MIICGGGITNADLIYNADGSVSCPVTGITPNFNNGVVFTCLDGSQIYNGSGAMHCADVSAGSALSSGLPLSLNTEQLNAAYSAGFVVAGSGVLMVMAVAFILKTLNLLR